jgi:hypothetical protein
MASGFSTSTGLVIGQRGNDVLGVTVVAGKDKYSVRVMVLQ